MAHKHSVYDTDTHFSIDAITRAITNEGSQKAMLMQNDHNAERFTFELPRLVDGHDMSLCNRVEVHYNNIAKQSLEQNKGVYECVDFQLAPDDENVVICSWLISGNATKYEGTLSFCLRFACMTDETIDYQWFSAIYSGISVSKGIYNTEYVAEEYADILAQWKAEIDEALAEGGTGLTEEQAADLAANTEARHGHENKDILDLIAKNKHGNLTLDGAIHWCVTNGGVIEGFETDETTGDITLFVRLVPNPAIPATEIKIKQSFDIPESGDVDLSNYYTKREIDSKGFITAEDILNGGGSPEELSILEKKLILSLFKNATYTADVSNVISALESVWKDDEAPLCHITNNLTNVNIDNSATDITTGDSYSATLTANDGYAIDSVVVMMNGEDITKTAYNSSGEVYISFVTGDISITAVAEKINYLSYEIGGIVTADGTETEAANRIKTDYIEITGEPIILSGYRFAGRLYDNAKNYIGGDSPSGTIEGVAENGWYIETFTPSTENSFVRLVIKKINDSNFVFGELDGVVLTVGNTKYRLKGV